jgi:hypothetical protein
MDQGRRPEASTAGQIAHTVFSRPMTTVGTSKTLIVKAFEAYQEVIT